MKVLVFEHAQQAAEAVANRLVERVLLRQNCTLGLATGGTVEPVYQHMFRMYEAGKVSFSKVRSFNLDEYVALPVEHELSYHSYMARHLFEPCDFDMAKTNIPDGNAADLAEEARRYETAISDGGGIDFQLLGIGENGHIGFNEPTSSLSMGIATILRADEIALLATGERKARAVRNMVEGPLSAMCPASALQLHRNVAIYLDPDAASMLELLDYYKSVHPCDGALRQ